MPTITIRLDDITKEQLEVLARSRGQSLSDLIRSALDRLLERDEDARPGVAPRNLTALERQQFALLHRILARLVGDDNDVDGDKAYQLKLAEVLENGFVREYQEEFAGIHPELGARDSEFIVDVLDLFRVITYSIERLQKDGTEVDEGLILHLRFRGFDLNDDREGQMLAYARFLINDGRWSELRYAFSDVNDNGNSHARLAGVYQRMLDEYEQIRATRTRDRGRLDDYLLTIDELRRLAEARIHPDNRE